MKKTNDQTTIPLWLARQIFTKIVDNYETIITAGLTAEEAVDDLLDSYSRLFSMVQNDIKADQNPQVSESRE